MVLIWIHEIQTTAGILFSIGHVLSRAESGVAAQPEYEWRDK